VIVQTVLNQMIVMVKKIVRWENDQNNNNNNNNIGSGVGSSGISKPNRPKSEHNSNRKEGRSGTPIYDIMKNNRSLTPYDQDERGSQTLNPQQLVYYRQAKEDQQENFNQNYHHTFHPSSHPPQKANSVGSSTPKMGNTIVGLPPLIAEQQNLPTTPHPSFVFPNEFNTSKPFQFYQKQQQQQQQIMSGSGGIPYPMSGSGGINNNNNNSNNNNTFQPTTTTTTTTTTNNNNNNRNNNSGSITSTNTSSVNTWIDWNNKEAHFEWEIEYSELEFGPLIGKGFFGEVKRGFWRETDVAIKIIYRDQFKTKSSLVMFQNEVGILSKLRHPNVVQFLGACTTGSEEHHCIVTEWMGGGSLRQFLTDYFHILEQNPHLRLKIALDIAKGMTYLHGWTPAILHRDLSSRNILLDHSIDPETLISKGHKFNDFKCKISDFGLSRLKMEQGERMTSSVGCIPYMAPEVFKGDSNSEKSDVYSFGMILWELLTSDEPQQDMKPMKMAHLAAYEHYRPPIPLTTSLKWREILTQCWDTLPEKRPTFKQIITHLKEMEEQGASSFAPIPVQTIDTGVYA